MIALDGKALAVLNGRFLPWNFGGYGHPSVLSGAVTLLTPPSIVKVFKSGYKPLWHSSAGA
jgi:hypothetical protein